MSGPCEATGPSKLKDLLTLAQDRGHTPGHRTVQEALHWLDKVDKDQVKRLEALIIRGQLPRAWSPPTLDDWKHPHRWIRLCTRIAAQDPKARTWLEASVHWGLQGQDPTVLRQVLRAMGRFEMVSLIDRALEHSTILGDPKLVELLAECAARCAGKSEAAASWVSSHAAAGSKAGLLAQRERYRAQHAQPLKIRPTACWLPGFDLLLFCKEGAQPWVQAELSGMQGLQVMAQGPGYLQVRTVKARPYAQVLAWRTVIDHAFVGRHASLFDLASDPELAAQLAELFGQDPASFRLHLEGAFAKSMDPWEQSAKVQTLCPQLVNDPRQSWIELRVGPRTQASGGLWVRPRLREQDHRFTYRVAQVPAASHPSVAAALAQAAKVRPNDRIWDPFVGSGLELIEAGLLAQPALLLGSDVDATAIECARANARAAQVTLQLEHTDARTLQLPALTKVLSNPPHGRRVAQNQDLAQLYRLVFERAYAALVSGGSVHWLCPQPEWVASRAQALGARARVLGSIDLGGMVVRYQRIDKP